MVRRILLFVLLSGTVALSASCSGGSAQPGGEPAVAVDQPLVPAFSASPVDPDGRYANDTGAGEMRPEPAKIVNAIAAPRFNSLDLSIRNGLGFLDTARTSLPYTRWGGTVYPDVYEWVLGNGSGSPNIPGTVSSDYMQAGMVLDDANLKANGLLTVDNYLVPVYSAGGPGATWRPYAADVMALYQAWQITGTQSYLDLAADLAGRTMSEFTGAGYADVIIAARHSLAGWDAAPYIFGWYVVGEECGDAEMTAWAEAMAGRMVERFADWDHNIVGTSTWGWDWSALSYGAMIKALTIVDAVGYGAEIAVMKTDLVSWQNEDGWWPMWWGVGPNEDAYDDVQATAFALEGLNVDGDASTILARFAGENYLRSSDIQGADGRFGSYVGGSTIYPEVCAEAIMALASMPWAGMEPGTNMVTGGGGFSGTEGPAKFAFNAKEKRGELKGSISLTDEDWGSLECSTLTSMNVYTHLGVIYGTGLVDGTSAAVVMLQVWDNGEPGIGADYCRIAIYDADTSITAPLYVSGGYLTEGNIQIHKK